MLKLRDYQREDLDTLQHLFYEKNEQRLLAIQFTGAGKTELLIQFVRECFDLDKQRVLILAQDTNLIHQMYGRFVVRVPSITQSFRTPLLVPELGIEMSSCMHSNARILIATRQTLARNECRRLQEVLKHGAFDALIIDEADLSITKEYLDIWKVLTEANPEIKLLGVTATAQRSDGLGLGILYDKIAVERDIRWGMLNGWLKPIDPRIVEAQLPNLDTASAMDVENWIQTHFDVWQQFDGPNRHALHFFPDLETARLYCRFMQEKHYPTVHIDSYMCIDLQGQTHEDKQMSYDAHRRNVVIPQLLKEAIYATNRSILSRGFDWRKCDMLLKSARMPADSSFTQMIGRGTRLPPGVSNMIPITTKGIYQVTWDDDRVEMLQEQDLPFNPSTILLDFSPSDASVITMGTLFGAMSLPEPKIITDEEEAEEGTGEIKISSLSGMATGTIITKRHLFRKLDTFWYQDVENETSTGFGQGNPYMIYISAPKLPLAKKLYGTLQRLKVEATDEKTNLQEIHRLTTLYTILTNWMVWVVEAEPTRWQGLQWTTATPCSSYYGDLPVKHATLESALGTAALLTNYMIRYMRDELNLTVDLEQLRKYDKSKLIPTDKQIKKLQTLITKSLPNAGWKSARVDAPQTLNEAVQAINHMQAKIVIVTLLNDIAKGEVWIDLVPGKEYGE